MRKKYWVVAGVLLALLASGGAAFAHGGGHDGAAASAEAEEGAMAVTVDGHLVPGQASLSKDLSELYLPARSVAEALGATVKWDAEHGALLIDTPDLPDMSGHGHTPNHGPVVVYKGQMLAPSLEPKMMNGTLMVSADTIAEAFGVQVKFDANSNRVLVTTPEAAAQFAGEEQQVKDALGGVGMKPVIAADGARSSP
ncbi:hypothetical protein SD70_22430 [Gordoniibacillus kamchatkensis]|uniref:Copper amine oxidase-like N-terminal domain-containing protein n=2 Tax=Gordoniibacillus kamchatkensis TaxID=1590651 RepID=A0ABR5ADW8_9BACL|nr:hypothetical protein SD70_22430 [Paenibacillus sp. VKM B-2647]